MLKKFKKYISENKLVNPGDKILLAVSGGIDSMTMTHLFIQAGYKVGIAHCNFSLRSAESDRDEQMVSEFASENRIPFFSKRFETKAYADENGISVQMAARTLRYEWFEKIRREYEYNSISVAHNLNDNIETLLINLIRGTGIAGLAGMKPETNNIIRPLLFATREEITEYSNLHSIIFREDKSNADTKYLRNKIRHNIIPILKEINPSIESTLNETAVIFTGLTEIVSDYIYSLRERVSRERNGRIIFNVGMLKQYIHNRIIIFELFRPYGIADVPLKDFLSIIEGETGGKIITQTHRILKNRQEIIVSDQKENAEGPGFINTADDFEKIPGVESAKSVRITKNFIIPSGPLTLCIDSDKLKFPLVVRKWKSGDYFYPLGLNHKKKLSNYFTDNKYSIIDKDNTLIIESEGQIVCLLGGRIDHRFRVTDTSENALIITVRQKAYPERTGS